MSALTAVILTTLLSTPIVQVSHDRIIESSRTYQTQAHRPKFSAIEFSGATDIGIDDAALNAFVEQANRRYHGF
nr:hypothetical protein [Amylibacter sp.]